MSTAIVNLRCSTRGCRRLLRSVTVWPAPDSDLWTGPQYGVWAERCPKHKAIYPRETLADADGRRSSQGRPPVDLEPLLVFVAWSKLRPLYLDSTHRGRAVDYLAP
jgi:hypothetical protein